MSGEYRDPTQHSPPSTLHSWARLLAARAPVYLDVPVLARKVPERSGPSRLVLELFAEGAAPQTPTAAQRPPAHDTGSVAGRLGLASVFPGEWYPGARGGSFSHYFLVLQRAFAGLEAEGREPRLRLQVLKAVNAGREHPYVVLLKFVVAPEFAITGARLEQLYQCPLAAYYQYFVGVGRDVQGDAAQFGIALYHESDES